MKLVTGSVAIIVTTVFLFWPLMKYFFFQDDFILLNMAGSVKNLADIFRFSDVIFWRPLSVQLYFNLARRLFGLEPLGYHLSSLLFHILNSLLVWKLADKLTKNKLLSWLTGFFFATSPIHFMSQIWIGEFPIILGQFFWLVGVLLMTRWFESPKWRNSLIVFLVFWLGLMSHEMVITMPFMLFGLIVLKGRASGRKEFILKNIWQLAYMLSPAAIYVLLRIVIFPIPAVGQYSFQLNAAALKSIWWYFLWLMNTPEDITYQSLFPLRIRPDFMTHFPMHSLLWMFQPILLGLLVGSISAVKKVRDFVWNKKYIQISAWWFVTGFSILLLALGHKYPFLLTFALPGWAMLIAVSATACTQVFTRPKRKLMFAGFVLLWMASSWLNLRFTESTHWTVKEALIAERLVFQVKQHPYILSSNVVVIPPGDDNQRRASLADQLGLQVILDNPSIKTYYSEPPKGFDDYIKKGVIVRIKG